MALQLRATRKRITNAKGVRPYLFWGLIYCRVGCKYRPNVFMEHLELSPFKSEYLESNFIAFLDALRDASSKWNPFTEVEWSTSLWQEHRTFDDTPFIVRNYPDIWTNRRCPTAGQFIKCSYQVDAHSDGLVSIPQSLSPCTRQYSLPRPYCELADQSGRVANANF